MERRGGNKVIVKAFAPDYSKKETLTNNPTTITKDGYILLNQSLENDTTRRVFINDVEVSYSTSGARYLNGNQSVGIYPVNAGDVVRWERHTVYFCPVREA